MMTKAEATPKSSAFIRWMGRSGPVLVGSHVDGVRAIVGLPLLFALLIGWEFVQHIIEVRLGFYDSPEAARAVANDASRMVFGWIKMASVYVGGFFVIRYLWRRDRDAAISPLAPAFLRYIPYIVYSLILFGLVFYAPQIVPAAHANTLRAVVGLGQVIIEPMLMIWIVAAATDGAVKTPLGSARMMGWLYFWAFVLYFVARLPVNLLHQFLNRYAMGQSDIVLWALLAFDALVVGMIIAVVPAIYVRIVTAIRASRS